MIDFREITIIDKCDTYENLIIENNVYKKNNYILTIFITIVIITSYLSYNERQKKEKMKEQ